MPDIMPVEMAAQFDEMYLLPVAVGLFALLVGEFSRRTQLGATIALLAVSSGLFARLGGGSVAGSYLVAILAVPLLFSPSWVGRFIKSFS